MALLSKPIPHNAAMERVVKKNVPNSSSCTDRLTLSWIIASSIQPSKIRAGHLHPWNSAWTRLRLTVFQLYRVQ